LGSPRVGRSLHIPIIRRSRHAFTIPLLANLLCRR
jgi:hypothetical protein